MPQDTGEPHHGMSAAETRHHLVQHGLALARIEQQLSRLESATGSGHAWSPLQWLKVLVGLALPLIVLLLTGNVELARKLLAP